MIGFSIRYNLFPGHHPNCKAFLAALIPTILAAHSTSCRAAVTCTSNAPSSLISVRATNCQSVYNKWFSGSAALYNYYNIYNCIDSKVQNSAGFGVCVPTKAPASPPTACSFGSTLHLGNETCASILPSYGNAGYPNSVQQQTFNKLNPGVTCQPPANGAYYCNPYKDPDSGLVASYQFSSDGVVPGTIDTQPFLDAQSAYQSSPSDGVNRAASHVKALCSKWSHGDYSDCYKQTMFLTEQALRSPNLYDDCFSPFNAEAGTYEAASNYVSKCNGHKYKIASNSAFNIWATHYRIGALPSSQGATLSVAANNGNDPISVDSKALDQYFSISTYPGADPLSPAVESSVAVQPYSPPPAGAAFSKTELEQQRLSLLRMGLGMTRNTALNLILGTNDTAPKVPSQPTEPEYMWRRQMLNQIKEMNSGDGSFAVSFVGAPSFSVVARAGLKWSKALIIGEIPVPADAEIRFAVPVLTCTTTLGCKDIFSSARGNGNLSSSIQVEAGAALTNFFPEAVRAPLAVYDIGIGTEVNIGLTENVHNWSTPRIDFVSFQANGKTPGVAFLNDVLQRNFNTGFSNINSSVSNFFANIPVKKFELNFEIPGVGPANVVLASTELLVKALGVPWDASKFLYFENRFAYQTTELNLPFVAIMNPNYVAQIGDKNAVFNSGWDTGKPYLVGGVGGGFYTGWRYSATYGVPESQFGEWTLRFQMYLAQKAFMGAAFSPGGQLGLYDLYQRLGGGA